MSGKEPFTATMNFRMLASALRKAGHTKSPNAGQIRTAAKSLGNEFVKWYEAESGKDTFDDTVAFHLQDEEVC